MYKHQYCPLSVLPSGILLMYRQHIWKVSSLMTSWCDTGNCIKDLHLVSVHPGAEQTVSWAERWTAGPGEGKMMEG